MPGDRLEWKKTRRAIVVGIVLVGSLAIVGTLVISGVRDTTDDAQGARTESRSAPPGSDSDAPLGAAADRDPHGDVDREIDRAREGEWLAPDEEASLQEETGFLSIGSDDRIADDRERFGVQRETTDTDAAGSPEEDQSGDKEIVAEDDEDVLLSVSDETVLRTVSFLEDTRPGTARLTLAGIPVGMVLQDTDVWERRILDALLGDDREDSRDQVLETYFDSAAGEFLVGELRDALLPLGDIRIAYRVGTVQDRTAPDQTPGEAAERSRAAPDQAPGEAAESSRTAPDQTPGEHTTDEDTLEIVLLYDDTAAMVILYRSGGTVVDGEVILREWEPGYTLSTDTHTGEGVLPFP